MQTSNRPFASWTAALRVGPAAHQRRPRGEVAERRPAGPDPRLPATGIAAVSAQLPLFPFLLRIRPPGSRPSRRARRWLAGGEAPGALPPLGRPRLRPGARPPGAQLPGDRSQPLPRLPSSGSPNGPLRPLAPVSPYGTAQPSLSDPLVAGHYARLPVPVPASDPAAATPGEIGREHVCTPVTNAHIVCRLRLEQKKNPHTI